MSDDERPGPSRMKDHYDQLKHKADPTVLREMMREKCKVRMREARQQQQDQGRGSPMEAENLGFDQEAMRIEVISEMQEMDEDLILERQSMIDFFDTSFTEALQDLEREEKILFPPEIKHFTCPICRNHHMNHVGNSYSCNCGIQFFYDGTPAQLQKAVDQVVTYHQKDCPMGLAFYTELNSDGRVCLSMLCTRCDFVYHIN